MGVGSGPMKKKPLFCKKQQPDNSRHCHWKCKMFSNRCVWSLPVAWRIAVSVIEGWSVLSVSSSPQTRPLKALILMGEAVAWHRPLIRYPGRCFAISHFIKLKKKKKAMSSFIMTKPLNENMHFTLWANSYCHKMFVNSVCGVSQNNTYAFLIFKNIHKK